MAAHQRAQRSACGQPEDNERFIVSGRQFEGQYIHYLSDMQPFDEHSVESSIRYGVGFHVEKIQYGYL